VDIFEIRLYLKVLSVVRLLANDFLGLLGTLIFAGDGLILLYLVWSFGICISLNEEVTSMELAINLNKSYQFYQ